MKKIILGSQSPGRKMLLEKLGIPFEAISSDFIEDMTLPLSAPDLALHLSGGKASTLAEKYPDDLIIAADTFVVFEDAFLGKPKNEEDARQTLSRLSGKTHTVLTGLTVIEGSKKITEIVYTEVLMKDLSEEMIHAYIATGECMEKAGSYAIQGKGGNLVEKIEGSHSNIMGLPLETLKKILKEEFDVKTS